MCKLAVSCVIIRSGIVEMKNLFPHEPIMREHGVSFWTLEMEIKMPLQKKGKQHPSTSKVPLPKRGQPQSNVTAAHSKASRLDNVPHNDEEKMNFLRSKLENSMSEFIKARNKMEEVLSAGGSSEQGPLNSEAAAEMKSELQRHRELTSKVKPLLKEKKPKNTCQDKAVPPNSYEFLKSLIG